MTEVTIIPAIDAEGRLYRVEKMQAHREDLLHLAVSVFVFSAGRLLIQKRAAGKYHSGGQWANTCCTHPDWGEGLAAAAHRRLREELTMDVPNLEHCAQLDYRAQVAGDLWENERVHVFRYVTDEVLPAPAGAPTEVSETRWIALPDLHQEVSRAPQDFAPWFRIYVSRWDELKLGVEI
ncbi:MAG: NUDIX domain-containing protein [Filomicrobium sp.]